MVTTIRDGGKSFYACGICKLAYKEKELAEKCEVWCRKHKSCNIKITREAVQLSKQKL